MHFLAIGLWANVTEYVIWHGTGSSSQLERKDLFSIVLHADDCPSVLLRLGHQRVGERADARLPAVSKLARCVVMMHEDHQPRGAICLLDQRPMDFSELILLFSPETLVIARSRCEGLILFAAAS